MELDLDRIELARQTRDPRFDGRFFVGVLTTGIYCRPVCPVRVPKKENIQLYPTAAAAAEAGFRPCLRCRPEVSPGTPAWLGSSFKVSKALQLIEQGIMDDGSVDQLAGQLDIGPRQLSRLFKQHIGASPISVAQTRRLHFAKQLIDETTLPMQEICYAAGFGSVRRFNDVVKRTYGLTPRQLRLRNRKPASNHPGVRITLSYRPPFNWRSMLAFLGTRAIPEVERVTDDSYRRTISIGSKVGEFSVQFSNSKPTIELTIDFADPSQLLIIVDRVKQLFDLRADSNVIGHDLAHDSFLAPSIKRYPGLRVPGCWEGFETAVRAIVGQQVSVKAASTLMARISNRLGLPYPTEATHSGEQLKRVFPGPEVLEKADLSGLGITGQRIDAIRAMASAVNSKQLSFDGSQSTEEFVDRICQIKGIGEWTGQYIAMRALRDPNAFPHGDLILQRAAGLPDERLTGKQLLALAEAWQPWRAYAVMLLWHRYQQENLND